jgi:hypothetical protein
MTEEGRMRFRLGRDGAGETLYVSGSWTSRARRLSSELWPGRWTVKAESSALTSVR